MGSGGEGVGCKSRLGAGLDHTGASLAYTGASVAYTPQVTSVPAR